jgi:hypothetical protein
MALYHLDEAFRQTVCDENAHQGPPAAAPGTRKAPATRP